MQNGLIAEDVLLTDLIQSLQAVRDAGGLVPSDQSKLHNALRNLAELQAANRVIQERFSEVIPGREDPPRREG